MESKYLVDKSEDGTAALEEELWQRAQELYGAGVSVDLSEDEVEELWQKGLEELWQASSPGDKKDGQAEDSTADLTDDEVWDAYELSHWNALADPEPRVEGGNVQRVEDDPSDEEVWQAYIELQDGTSSRRRALQNARDEQAARESEWVEYCKQSGSPLPTQMEHLRPRLKEHGY